MKTGWGEGNSFFLCQIEGCQDVTSSIFLPPQLANKMVDLSTRMARWQAPSGRFVKTGELGQENSLVLRKGAKWGKVGDPSQFPWCLFPPAGPLYNSIFFRTHRNDDDDDDHGDGDHDDDSLSYNDDDDDAGCLFSPSGPLYNSISPHQRNPLSWKKSMK